MKDFINNKLSPDTAERYMVWFFAGSDNSEDKFNIFTGSYLKLMKQILGDNFDLVRGIYFKSPMLNTIWALNNAQRPFEKPGYDRITTTAFNQIITPIQYSDTQLVLTSSSSGSIVAAQTACFLAKKNKNNTFFMKPFHLVLGSSLISKRSELFRQLEQYQKDGAIGTMILDELLDEGDNIAGIGGVTRHEAYRNAFGIMLPHFSKKFNGPSFLNTDPEKGHLHRRRSQTIQKALDFIDVILIKNKLAGEEYKERATTIIENKKLKKSI
jgi:hypothetical protein